jgi:methylenetetrahydrofolate dehydrogenase (NADP+)/methenyltetrahydrofolate cyclohydrolase
MQILDGNHVAKVRRESLKYEITAFSKVARRSPGLSVILVGDHAPSQVYVRNKIRACHDVGMVSREVRLPATLTQAELHKTIETLNGDPVVDGILVQLPLPSHLSAEAALALLNPAKDVDALTVHSQGLLFAGRPQALPCTPGGIIHLLEHYQIALRGKSAVVIGRSNIVGKPMAQLLLQHDCTVTQCHSRTLDIRQYTQRADLVVVAAGQPEMFGRDDFKKDAIVIDVGIHRIPTDDGKGRLVGDVRFAELKGWVQAATPVPGGVGPMTITTLLENTLRLAQTRVV